MDPDPALSFLPRSSAICFRRKTTIFCLLTHVAEVVEELLEPANRRELVEAVERIRLDDFSKSSSEYGPVRNAASFEPPDEEEIAKIIARRFSPIIGIFK